MAKRRKRADHPRGPQRRPVRHGAGRREPDRPEGLELLQTLRTALRSEDPMDFLQAISGVLELADWRGLHHAFQAPSSVTLDQLVDSFEGTDYAQTTAALRVIEEFTSDEVLRARVRRTLRTRQQRLPRWLADLDQTRIERVEFAGHILRDGDDYLLDVRFAGGERATALVYVDHNMGEVVKDAFMISEPVESVLAVVEREGDDGSTRSRVDPAEARAIMERAIEGGARRHPPFESETWPLVRPLALWLCSLLPSGGTAPERREWRDEELDEIAEDFLSSRWGSSYDDPDGRETLDGLLWLASSYGPCDPLVWSAVRIEMIMADLFPRKVPVTRKAAQRLPALLKDFVRFAHTQQTIPDSLTLEVLAAVDHWRPVFESAIQGTMTTFDDDEIAEILERLRQDRLDWLADAVGGQEALESLATEPLPDEPFDWTNAPDDVAGRFGEILELCDSNAEQFLDVEHRTANRRLLRRVLLSDPAFFRGRASARTSAAAICWLVARANDSVGPDQPVTTAELMEPFRVSGGGERAQRFLRSLGVRLETWDAVHLGSADLLVAARRERLLELRDQGG